MRYFAGFLVIVALILFGIVIFGSTSGTNTKKTSTGQVAKTLPEYASTGAEVRLTVDGFINGDDDHRQVRISINSRVRTVDIIQGYRGNVIATESFENNESAFSAFLHAIYKAGYTSKLNPKVNKYASDGDQGSCPLGKRIYFEVANTGDAAEQRLWSSSCGKQVPGNLNGNAFLIEQLFKYQITNYADFTHGLGL